MSADARKIRMVMELRGQGITDADVLGAIERVPREAFVPTAFRDQAYDNTALPIGHGQTISQPAVVGFMTQCLEVGRRMKVLEIGTGSGYQAAVLSFLCRRVYTIERCGELLREAEARFRALGLNNVTARFGDGCAGWPEIPAFERILVTAASAAPPPALFDQLAPGGVMIAPVGDRPDNQRLCKYRRDEDGTIAQETLWPVRFVPLVPGTEQGARPTAKETAKPRRIAG